MTFLALVIVTLAAHRLTRLVVTDTILDAPRNWVFTHAPVRISELINCPHCTGFWAALACVCVYLAAPDVGLKVLAPFTAAGGVSLLAGWDGRG